MDGNPIKQKHGLWLSVMLITLLAINGAACSLPKPHVGKQVDTTRWCRCVRLPATCVQQNKYFIYEYTVSKGEPEGQCTIRGTMDASTGRVKSWGRIMHEKSQFRILLANDGIIVDNIPFRPMGDRLTGKIDFNAHFPCQPFDAVFFISEFSVRG